MIDCLYTGPATDSIDIQAIRIANDMNFINPILFECDDHWNIPAKAPQSLKDRVPEKG